MPRELGDVLHYFLPAAGQEPQSPEARDVQARASNTPTSTPTSTPTPTSSGASAPRVHGAPDASEPDQKYTPRRSISALSIVAVPLEPDDAIRGALVWNLAVEIARHGGRCVLLRTTAEPGSDWPLAGRQPLGAEVVICPARNLSELYRGAVDAALLPTGGGGAGVVLVQVPPAWLDAPGDGAALLRWCLLLGGCESDDLAITFGRARSIVAARPDARVGVTLHGATSRHGAEASLGSLARVFRTRLGHDLSSYGLLVDDLHVFRATEARRPIGLSHPQSLAARALHDVAGLLLEDARHLTPA